MDYLGRYLRENYNVPDHRNDPAYANWYRLLLNGEVFCTADAATPSNYDYRVAVYNLEGQLLDFKEMHLN